MTVWANGRRRYLVDGYRVINGPVQFEKLPPQTPKVPGARFEGPMWRDQLRAHPRRWALLPVDPTKLRTGKERFRGLNQERDFEFVERIVDGAVRIYGRYVGGKP